MVLVRSGTHIYLLYLKCSYQLDDAREAESCSSARSYTSSANEQDSLLALSLHRGSNRRMPPEMSEAMEQLG